MRSYSKQIATVHVVRASRYLRRAAERGANPYSIFEAHLLLFLQGTKSNLDSRTILQGRVKNVFGVTDGYVSRVLGMLEENALVERVRASGNYMVMLTFKGTQVASVARKRLRDIWRKIANKACVDVDHVDRAAAKLGSLEKIEGGDVESPFLTLTRFLDREGEAAFKQFKIKLAKFIPQLQFDHPSIPNILSRMGQLEAVACYELLVADVVGEKVATAQQLSLLASHGLINMKGSRMVSAFGEIFRKTFEESYAKLASAVVDLELGSFTERVSGFETSATPLSHRSRS